LALSVTASSKSNQSSSLYTFTRECLPSDNIWRFGCGNGDPISLSRSIYKYSTHCNQYFVWLYEYKANHPKSELMMEYDVVQDEESESREEQAVAPALLLLWKLGLVGGVGAKIHYHQ
jgi:hypothetical protein